MQFGGEGLGIGSFEVGGAAMHSMMKKQSLSHLSGQVSGCDTHTHTPHITPATRTDPGQEVSRRPPADHFLYKIRPLGTDPGQEVSRRPPADHFSYKIRPLVPTG